MESKTVRAQGWYRVYRKSGAALLRYWMHGIHGNYWVYHEVDWPSVDDSHYGKIDDELVMTDQGGLCR